MAQQTEIDGNLRIYFNFFRQQKFIKLTIDMAGPISNAVLVIHFVQLECRISFLWRLAYVPSNSQRVFFYATSKCGSRVSRVQAQRVRYSAVILISSSSAITLTDIVRTDKRMKGGNFKTHFREEIKNSAFSLLHFLFLFFFLILVWICCCDGV